MLWEQNTTSQPPTFLDSVWWNLAENATTWQPTLIGNCCFIDLLWMWKNLARLGIELRLPSMHFLLCKSCAEYPKEIQHPFHPNTLLLCWIIVGLVSSAVMSVAKYTPVRRGNICRSPYSLCPSLVQHCLTWEQKDGKLLGGVLPDKTLRRSSLHT